MEIQEKVSRFKEMGIEAILKDENACAEFGYLWKSLYNEKICVGCNGKIRQAFDSLMNQQPEKLQIMSQRKFIMMPGKLIDRTMASKAPFGMFNADNITDENALALLRAARGYIKFFKDYPDNWEELLSKKPATAKTPDATPEPVPEAVTDNPLDTPEVHKRIELETELAGKTSTDFNAKVVIDILDRFDLVELIETFTAGEHELEKKRKTVLKAIKKRIRQLSE